MGSARMINELYPYKKSETCVFLGSGPSINEITPEQWAAIKECDMWAINNWVYHPDVVPDFLHIEVKHYNYYLMQKRLAEKRDAYLNVKFLFARNKHIKMPSGQRLALKDVAIGFFHIFEYDLVARDKRRTHAIFSADYHIDKSNKTTLTKSYDMSITQILELLYRFGYERIILYGVDLGSSEYFWTGGDSKYGEVHHQTNKAHEGKDPILPHATVKVKDLIVDFNNRLMVPNNREIFVGHTKTLLYPELRHFDMLTMGPTESLV